MHITYNWEINGTDTHALHAHGKILHLLCAVSIDYAMHSLHSYICVYVRPKAELPMRWWQPHADTHIIYTCEHIYLLITLRVCVRAGTSALSPRFVCVCFYGDKYISVGANCLRSNRQVTRTVKGNTHTRTHMCLCRTLACLCTQFLSA